MQGCLLALCFVWKARQQRLGVDDFGKPLPGHEPAPAPAPAPHPQPVATTEAGVESQPHRQPTLGPADVEHGRGEDELAYSSERTPLLSSGAAAQSGVNSKAPVDRWPWLVKK